jgi:uncharacterized protein YbbC (DUF1343 family)
MGSFLIVEKQIWNRKEKILLGCENFLANHMDLAKGKRLGLVTNQTGVDSRLDSLIDLFHNHRSIDLVALFGPEHGLRGNAQAGEHVPFYRDEKTGLPVYSLYGQSRKLDSSQSKDPDAAMRSFDTVAEGKSPDISMLSNVDVMAFDIQDIGTRIYTYISTMAYCMQACAEKGIEFVVLDRPNPINGKDMEGPILKYPEFSSFVGHYPIPVRHGMTIGELALLFNDRFLPKKVNLTVIPMKGWKRDMWYDQTGFPWILPSPNMPTLQAAMVYPGQVFLEGTNVSEGRGTTKPFEVFGTPWINSQDLVSTLNTLKLPGVTFTDIWFTPFFSKFRGELCRGAQLHVRDRESYQPFRTTLHIIQTVRNMCPDKFAFYADYFDKIAGSASIRKALEKGDRIEEIMDSFNARLEEFKKLRNAYLLY